MDHILSDLSTMTHPSWVVPQAWLDFIGCRQLRAGTLSKAERSYPMSKARAVARRSNPTPREWWLCGCRRA